MSNHKGARKTLAVFMAVLMVMSCWVFTPISLKAEALSSGKYYVTITWNLYNRRDGGIPKKYEGYSKLAGEGRDSGDNNCAGISLFFKRNNGTDTTTDEVYWSFGSSSSKGKGQITGSDATVYDSTGVITDKEGANYELKAILPGYPTKLYAFLDNNHVTRYVEYKVKSIKVGSSFDEKDMTTIWDGDLHLKSHLNADYGMLNSNYKLTESKDATLDTTTRKWNAPAAKTIVWDTDTANWSSNNLIDLTIHTGSNNVSRLAKFHVVDQYGVNMSTAALSSLNTPVGATVKSTNYATSGASLGKTTTLNTTTTNNLYYTVSDKSASYQVDVVAKPALKSLEKGLNERLVTVTAKAGTGVTSSKTFKIYDPKYRITFDGNGGSVSPTYYDVYYGESLKSQAALDSKSTYPVGGTRTGYTWLGMFDKADGGNLMNVEDDVTAAKKYFAHWDKNLYTVVFLNRKGEYVDVQYIYHGENADSATPASKLKKVEYDSAKHYTLNESAPWSPGVTNITANVITKAQYVAEEHDFDNGVSVAATCHSGAGTKYTCEICGYSYIKDESTDRAPHQFGDALTITKEPTCTATGIGYKTCTVCGEHSEDVTVPATGHSYKISKTDATCSKEGSITYTCTKGDDTHTEVLPKTQHNMVAGAKVAATCTSAAYTPYTCADCSYSYNVYDASQPAVGHNWGVWSVTTAATNTADGVMSRTCSKCNKTETVTIPKGGHTFPTTPTSETPATCHSTGTQTFKCTAHTNCGVSITVTTAKTAHNYKTTINNATCTSAGSVVSACQNSGCTEKITTTLPASGHNYETSAVTKEPTCTETGVRTYTCSKCNTTKTETIPASGHKTVTVEPTCTQNGKTVCAVCGYTTTTAKLGHSYGAWDTVISATCKNQGVRKHVCTRTDCGHTEIETTPTTDHTWNADKTVDYDSTCSTLGQKSTHCSICGTIKDGSKETIAKKAHTMGTAQTVVEPTCTGKGVTKTVCSVCGYTETATVAALGHDYSVTVSDTPATCTKAGVKTVRCSRCGDENTVVTQPTGHKFVAGTPVAASCKDAGHVTMTCACGESYEKYISAPTNNHNWSYTVSVSHGKTVISGKCSVCGATFSTSADSDHELTKVKSYTPATCKSEGTLVLECAVSGCTQTHTVTLAVNLNAHANVTVTETKATCTSDGSIVTKCADCGKTLSTTAVPKTGHAFNIQTDYTAPTCKSEGSVTYKCNACNETKTDTLAINPDAHKFTKGAHHNADCTHPEYDEYNCKYCGESYNSFSGSANGHTYTTTTSQSGTTLTITCKCSVCGDTHTQTVEVAEGHNYTDVTVDKEPTCSAEGTMTIACDGKHKAGCASVITVSVPKNSKAHNIETRYTAPDCKTGGSVITACANGCGLIENKIEIAPLGHEWDNGEVTTAASCESDGVMTYTCTRGDCGETRTEVIAKLGHKWNVGESHEADCTHGEYTRFTCETCGKTYDDVADGATALGHSWNSGEVTAEPTCTEDGVKTYTCNRCGDTKTEAVSKLGHNYVEGAHHDATCTSAAYTEYKCANCDSSYNAYDASQPAVGHNWGAWSETKEATNSEDGVMSRTCSKCGDTETVTVPKGGHTLALKSEVPATCSSEGKQIFACTAHENCGVSIEVATAKLAHTLKTTVVPATCTAAGSVSTECTKCGEVNEVTEIPALGHAYDDEHSEKHEADCTHSGYTTYTCTRNCGNTINVYDKDAEGHVWSKTAFDSTATCTERGMATYKCEKCNSTIEVEAAALGHDYSELTETVEATCNSVGHKTYKCSRSRCEATHTEYSDKLGGHKFGALQEIQTATDVLPGIKVRKCETCGLYEYDYTAPTGAHEYDGGVVTKKATCTQDGEKTYTCISEHCGCTDGNRATYTEVIPATGHDKVLDFVDATCVEDGHATVKCTVCGAVFENKTVSAKGHTYGDVPSSATAPTCTNDGAISYKCDNCGETTETTLPATGAHKLTFVKTVEATCTTQGYTLYKCADCDYTCIKDLTKLAAHTAGEAETVVEPTCTTSGYKQTKCKDCDTVLSTELIVPTPHSYTETVTKTVDNADGDSCLKAEYTYNKCSCGAVDESSITVTAPKGHDWGEWTVVTPSSNTEDGKMQRICNNDASHVETVIIPKGGHEFDTLNPTGETPATCHSKGEKTFECTAHVSADGKNTCGVTITVETEMLAHELETVRKDGNCTEAGTVTTKCVADGCTYSITTEIPALGHIYGEGEITKEATCQTKGEVTFSCTREGCDHKLTKATPTVQHEYKANGEPVKATCLKSGYQNYKCVNCDDNYDVILENATGHRYAKLDTSTEADCTTAGHSYYKCENCDAAYDYEIPAKGHSYIGKVTQNATCAQPEITTYTCSNCGDSYEVITAVPTAHSWSVWTVTKAATENTAGEEERHCEGCGLTETAPIPATDAHVIVEDTERYVPATCETEGKRVYVCTIHDNCTAGYTVTLAPLGHKTELRHEDAKCNVGGYSRVVCTVCDKVLAETTIAALKHSFVEIEGTRVAPTCSADGSISYKCENCGEEKTVSVEAVKDAHKLSVYKTVESTCTTQGYTLYKCDNCEYTRKDDLKPLAPHKIATNETVSATCTGDGYIKSVCECGAIVSIEAIPATGHTYETKTAEGDGCLTSGYTYEECAVCGNIRNITVSEAANHEYEQRITPATCTEGGTVEIYCKNCDKAVKTITTEALGHNFGGAPTTVNPTCEHEGSVTYSCQRTGCDETLTHKLDKIPHNYQSKGTFPATCKNSGYELFVCADCKAEYKNITTKATGHHYGDDPENANVAATCFEDGHVYKKCKDCDAAYDYVVPATGEHVYDSGTVVTPASCLDSEVTEYRCTTDGCTAAYREVTASAKGHDYTDWTYSHSTATGVCKCGATVTVENVDKEAGHNWVYNRITKAATCKEQGYIEFVCGDGKTCSATLTKAYGPIADAHVWDGGEITAEPDCETDGVKTYTCAECGETKTETVAKLGHEYTVFVEKVEATCVSDGHITYKCSRCDSEKTQVIAKNESNHSYKAVTTDPTCLEDGYTTMICELCGHEGEKTVNAGSALGHDEEVITVAPTCKEAGSRITQCKRCHTVLKTEGIAPVDHTWNDGVITTEPKCETDGVKTYTCAKCGETKTETVARLNHDYSVLVESVDSSCVADGHNTYKCSRCDSAKTELIAKDPDKHTLESVTVAPTCLEDGYTVDRCKLCGYESEKRDIVSALGHDEETIIVARTCTEAGSETVRCKRCEAVLSTHGVAPLGHDYITTPITEATCTDSGENRITCSRCDYLAIETVPAKGHKWDNGTVITEGDCETKKVTRFTCTQCGITKDVLSGDLGKHDYKFVKTVAPTCTDEGYDLYECSRCHKQQQTKFVEALGHDWGYWNVVKYPTETETGLQERFCNRCGEREEQTIVYGKFYLVTFYNYDGTRLMPPAYYEYGAKALRPKTDPVKAADTAYTYEYIGWNFEDRQIDFVTERMAIIAQYKAHERYYTVTYKDEDGAVLAVVPNIPFSQIAEKYPNGTPTKASDELNDYTFSSWSINCNSNTGEAVATATYKATEKKPGAQPAGKPGIFSKFIEWLRNLFKKLFGRG